MIRSFRNKALQRFFETGDARKLSVQNHARVSRILVTLHQAVSPTELNVPGYKFHQLSSGKRWSVWVTGNYRITFGFDGPDAIDIDLEDYH